GRVAARGAHGRSPRAARGAGDPAGPAGRAGRLPRCVRRSRVPTDARHVRWAGRAGRDAGLRPRAADRDRVRAPAGRAARVDRGRDRRVLRGVRASWEAPVTHNRWNPALEPVATIASGDELRLETEDGMAGQFTRASTHEDCARFDSMLAHPLTGPV